MELKASLKANFEKLKTELDQQLTTVIPGTLVKQEIAKEYNEGVQEINTAFGITSQPLPTRIEYLSEYTFDNIKNMTSEIAGKLRGELTRSYLGNKGIDSLRESVQDIMDVAKNRAEMIARTELSRAYNTGSLDAARQSPLTMKKYLVITYDKRTSEVSKLMGEKYGSEEKAIPLDEPFSVTYKGKEYMGLTPPFMPNDRDTVVYVEVEDE